MAATNKTRKPTSASTRTSAKKPPMSVLARALHSLPASGEAGFEGLIAKLLTKLTGVPFLVRRSGSQQGRDADSSVNAAECIFVECKRYEESSSLDERGLRTQIEISANAAPDFDMWVLATTRSVDASAAEWLAKKTREMGADFYVLSCGSLSQPADLDYLAAAFWNDVISICKGSDTDSATLHEYLRKVKESAEFDSALARIRKAFESATVGLPSFRSRLNALLCKTLEHEETSRLRLNAPLASGELTPVNVPRPAVQQHLESFALTSRAAGTPRICVIQGDEGNGKSWAVATWVRGMISKQSAPPVFWFKSSASKELGLKDLARLAVTQLQTSEEDVFRLKLQRWLGRTSDARGIVVLDGINERHSFQFWTDYIANLVAELGPNVLFVITCRLETWRRQLKPRLNLQAIEFDLSEFNEQEFAGAMHNQPREIVEKLWALGSVARKPRYLADALAYLRQGGDASELTVEMLQYHAWKYRYRRRMDYPVAPDEFENVLKHLATEMSRRVTAGELKELLAFNPHAVDALAELASGGVLRRDGIAVILERPYLVEGLSLLLVDALALDVGTVAELRQQIGIFVHDTQRNPLTAEICASAAYKALADETMRDEVAVALTLEFLDCQNADQTSVEGVIALASKRPHVIAQVAEELWAVPGVDSTIEQMILHGLIQIAKNASPGSAIVNVLARWSSFIHEHGEFYRRDAGDLADRASASVNAVAPTIGRVQLTEDGSVVLTRVENQRLLRLARLALAVISLADRQTFFQVAFNSLIADSVMLTFRGNISGWILGSSRSALGQQVAAALQRVETMSLVSVDGKARIRRTLLESAADPALALQLRSARKEAEEAIRNDPQRNLFRSPTREELPAFLSSADAGFRRKLQAASMYASDPTFDYPNDFVCELRAYAQSFTVANRRVVRGQTIEDHNWELLEPLLCRLCQDLYVLMVRDFIRTIAQRENEAIYPWLFAADGYVSLFEATEVALVRQVWEGLLTTVGNDTDNLKTIEFILFGMLLAHMTPQQQVQELLRRGDSRAHLVSFTNEFRQLASPEAQEQIAGLAAADDQLLPVLWYAVEQEEPASVVWLPLIDRALANLNGVARGFALELLFQMPEAEVRNRLGRLELTGQPTHLEKYWFTRLLLQHSTDTPSALLSRCDFATCAEVLGMVTGERQHELVTAFSGHVLAWLLLQVDPQQPPSPELRVIVQSQAPDRRGLASVSVDWGQIDSTVSFRSELSSWGGLEQGDGFGALEDSFSDRQFADLQNALMDAMRSADERGNWAYTACWSDSTLTVMLDKVLGFQDEVLALIEHAKNRKRLRSIGSFVSALARVLLNSGDAMGLELISLIRAEDVVVRSVDGWTEGDLLDAALSSYPRPDEASNLWLERIDASKSDAYVLANCELLVQGGNRVWLLGQAERDLSSDAPYVRRRGLLLLAGSGCNKCDLDAAVLALGGDVTGLEDVVQTATGYIERLSRMRKWISATMLADSASEAKCAATLLLHCADSRVWLLLVEAENEYEQPRCGAPLMQLLPHGDVKKAVKATLKQRDKFLLGYQKAENDAAPWLQSEAQASVRLPI
jgi:hypothetical protein